MHVIPLLQRKRDGASLTPDEWTELVTEYTAGRIPEYQMAALLMAVFLRGVTDLELAALTDAMLHSGAILSFGNGVPPRVDKHSTGGVGDKVSLVLAPLVASCGVAVPMMSGRGLGHTAGTLDKLESIPGFRTDMSLQETVQQVERLGCAMIGQTAEVAPADRKLYALRDATATVEVIPLIAASIMSKKLAEGLNGLVLDVKAGSGAFLSDPDDSVALAQTMIALGEQHDCPTVALVTAMDRPLGRTCGNALETREAFEALLGNGPADLMEVTFALGTEMLQLAGVESDSTRARRRLEQALASGAAVDKLRLVIEAQGGDATVIDYPERLGEAPLRTVYTAPTSGIVTAMEPRRIGRGVIEMGGGRDHKDARIDRSVGFDLRVKPGDRVGTGDPIAEIHAADARGAALGTAALQDAVVIAATPPPAAFPLISHRISRSGVQVL